MTVIDVYRLSTWSEKSKGLLGASVVKPVYFKTRFGIHTFFMQFPIDVIILDRNNNIKSLKENLMPNNIFLWHPKYDQVLELGAGMVKKLNLQPNHTIKLRFL